MNRTDTTQPWELTSEQQQRLRRDIMPTYQGQINRCAQAVHTQRIAEEITGAILRYSQSTEGIQRAQRAQQEIERQQRQQVAARKTVYSGAPSGMITRSRPQSREEQARAFIAQQQANLRRDNERMAELRRQVQRERVGYR